MRGLEPRSMLLPGIRHDLRNDSIDCLQLCFHSVAAAPAWPRNASLRRRIAWHSGWFDMLYPLLPFCKHRYPCGLINRICADALLIKLLTFAVSVFRCRSRFAVSGFFAAASRAANIVSTLYAISFGASHIPLNSRSFFIGTIAANQFATFGNCSRL